MSSSMSSHLKRLHSFEHAWRDHRYNDADALLLLETLLSLIESPLSMLRLMTLVVLTVVAVQPSGTLSAQDKSIKTDSKLVFPIISKYGGIVARPGAAEQPRAGAKVVFDITADSKPGDVNKGLERAARLLNLYGAAGMRAADVKIVIVLHGEATKSVLNDAAYNARSEIERNPNLPLIRALRAAGVDIFVCGQALHNKGIPDAEVADQVQIAAAALTVVINKQMDGYACILIP